MKKYHRRHSVLLNLFHVLLVLALLQVPSVGYAQGSIDLCSRHAMSYDRFHIDGVELEFCTSLIANIKFVSSDPKSIVQMATALDETDIRRSISVSAIPYGLQSPVEGLPVAFRGGVTAYRELTREYRQSQGGSPAYIDPIQLLGQTAIGIASTSTMLNNEPPVMLYEWFAEARERIWIVRITIPSDKHSIGNSEVKSFADQIEIRSLSLSVPSASLVVASQPPEPHNLDSQEVQITNSNLPFPSWWNGECNVKNHSGSYALGSSYRGVKACGPSGRFRLVNFFPNAWGALEWQCVELVMRFMYLAYGVKPYPAHGKDVVKNFPINDYKSLKVEKIANGTPQKTPRPGDIISYGRNTEYGHTSIVIESNIDKNGNGSIKIIEQNNGSGTQTHQVKNWVVNSALVVENWLRFNSSGSGTTPPPPNRSPNRPSPNSPNDRHIQRDGRAPTLCWNNNGDPDSDRVQFYAEVFDSARNANSGWQDSTCWRPSSLDGGYFNYQWRVKARDNRGGESGWSDVRRFTIESPNQPPTISFNTANGNSSARITSRDQTWTFQGSAGDPEGRFSRVEFRCNDCDNAGSGQSSSTSSAWTITRDGMSGRNSVSFEAYDDQQSTRSAKTLELNIDLAAPTTAIEINGQSPDDWPTWFNEPAQVRLNGRDNGTGRAVADMREVRYRRNGGGEQVQSGSTVNFTETSDGEHTIRYYAVDNVGNAESERSATYRIDRTPPTAITGLQSNGVVNNQWQKSQNKPTFTWSASTDALSGLGGYQFYFGEDANGTAVHFDVAANAPRTLTPNNLGVATGTYYLRGRTWDKAGNTSAWQTLFTFRYDGTPPPNPEQATHTNGPKNDTWQKITAQPNFTWTAPVDEGSGIKGYLSYWGSDPNGESSNLITTNSFQSATPLCGQGQACTGYLRLRSQDNVGHNAEKWSTTFVLRYDGAPPVANFTISGGITQTAQTLVTLDLTSTDLGSGLREMRFSSDGSSWTNWERYADRRIWEIPAISRQSWPIYLQVKDAVGWESTVISRTIYFDVNVAQPRSSNYRLFNYAQVAGAGAHTSQPTGYKGHSTLGQVHDSPRLTSASYSLASGYEAGSRAIPLVIPKHDTFAFINSIFASGVVNGTLKSGQYRMIGVWGEPALPNNRTEIASSSYRLQPGFLAARPSAQGASVPTPTPTPSPTPSPTPTPACEFPRVSINEGAVFATNTRVNLNLCAPNVTEMMVSNDGGFAGATWEPYVRNKAWTLTSHSNYVLPRFVYVAFRDAKGQIYATYLDEIILDPNPPEATVRVGSNLPLGETVLPSVHVASEGSAAYRTEGASYLSRVDGRLLDKPLPVLATGTDGVIDLYLSARDQVGNVTGMQISENGLFGTTWESYSAVKQWTPTGGDGVKTVYARFRDEAGNASTPYTTTFVLDTQPPIGGIALSHPILGPNVVTTTVWLGAEDNLSGVDSMRLSSDPTFADAVWRPFAPTLTWVYSNNDRSRSALYVQFRDVVGNESTVLNAPLQVDMTPPLVYVEVDGGTTLTRTVRIYSYDELTYPDQMRLTNDPLFLKGVVTQPYHETVTWTFDSRQVVWVQVRDAVGNWSEAWPAYGGYAPAPTTPTATTTRTATPTPTRTATTTPTATPISGSEGQPTLSSNYLDGAPGSNFLIEGYYFPAGAAVQLFINSTLLGTPITIDGDGRFRVLLATSSSASMGYYVVTATVITSSARFAQTNLSSTPQRSYRLGADVPLRQAPVGAPTPLPVPTSLPAFERSPVVYLPLVRR